MIARGFKSVVWVAAVGGAALGCYMLSLQVATERADLARVEARIIATKQQIRSLQTELGTRGRLSQLEQWNSEVLALSAPASAQFLDNEVLLARLDMREQTVAERATVRMAAMESDEAPAAAAPPADARPKLAVEAKAPPAVQPAIVHRAGYVPPAPAEAAAKPARRLGGELADQLADAARDEKAGRAPTARPDTARAALNRAEASRSAAAPERAARAETARPKAKPAATDPASSDGGAAAGRARGEAGSAGNR